MSLEGYYQDYKGSRERGSKSPGMGKSVGKRTRGRNVPAGLTEEGGYDTE